MIRKSEPVKIYRLAFWRAVPFIFYILSKIDCMKKFLTHLSRITLATLLAAAILVALFDTSLPDKLAPYMGHYLNYIAPLFLLIASLYIVAWYWHDLSNNGGTITDKYGYTQTKFHPLSAYLRNWLGTIKRTWRDANDFYDHPRLMALALVFLPIFTDEFNYSYHDEQLVPYAGNIIAPRTDSWGTHTADSRYLREWAKDVGQDKVRLTEVNLEEKRPTAKPIWETTALLGGIAVLVILCAMLYHTPDMPSIFPIALLILALAVVGFIVILWLPTKAPDRVVITDEPYPEGTITLHGVSNWHSTAVTILAITDYATRTARPRAEAVERIELALRGYIFCLPGGGTYTPATPEAAYEWARQELYQHSVITPEADSQNAERIGTYHHTFINNEAGEGQG